MLVCGNCLKRPALRAKCGYSSNTAECSSPTLHTPNPLASVETNVPLSELESGPVQHQPLGDVLAPGIVSASQPHDRYLPEPLPPTMPDSHTDYNYTSNAKIGSSSHSTFTGQIRAAIDLRSGGMARSQSPSATPLIDVPIFPSHIPNNSNPQLRKLQHEMFEVGIVRHHPLSSLSSYPPQYPLLTSSNPS